MADSTVQLMLQNQPSSDDLDYKTDTYRKWVIGLTIVAVMLALLVVTLIIVIAVDHARTHKRGDIPWTRTSSPSTSHAQWPEPSNSPLYQFDKVAVAADIGLCSEIGRNILIKGGNAVDAAIATNICQGALNGQSSGLGGGFFLTYYERKSKSCVTIDAREYAGAQAHKNMFQNKSSKQGYLASAIPGELYGMRQVWENFGSRKFKNWFALFQPTIQLLQNGFPVSDHLARVLQHNSVRNHLTAENGLDIFINRATGQPYKKGDIITRKLYAETLTELAESLDPIGTFYKKFAKILVDESKRGGGIWEIEDFNNYKSILSTTPITVRINENDVICVPRPPSSGVIVGAILRVLKHFAFKDRKTDFDTSVLNYHRLIETFKFAYAARGGLGDPADAEHKEEVEQSVQKLTSDWWAEEVFHLIKNYSLPIEAYQAVAEQVNDAGTTQINVVDAEGNAVAITASVNMYFGCLKRSPKLGIILNNEMDDFSQPSRTNEFGFVASPQNFIKPFKRPQSSMTPSVIFNKLTGDVRMVLGAAGGSRIISAISQVAIGYLSFSETIKEAVDAPRLHNQYLPHNTCYEASFPEKYIRTLSHRYGQTMIKDDPREISVVTAIVRNSAGKLEANCDFRKPGGYPAGY